MSADVVADALAAGVRDAGGNAAIVALADGGEGTADVLRKPLNANAITIPTSGPLGQPMEGSILISGDGTIAVVETATATGLHMSSPTPENAETATPYGTGVLIAAAAATGGSEIRIGVGGSASTDGGRGALRAIADAGGLGNSTLTILCDVVTPYIDAARVFGPQKGADPDSVRRLERALNEFAEKLPRDPRQVPRTGAAGGLAGAIWAVHAACLVSGIDHVLDTVKFDELLAGADAVITGEGRLDGQTAQGKVISGVTARALRFKIPVWAAVGRCDVSPNDLHNLHIDAVVEAGNPNTLREAARSLTSVALRGSRTRTAACQERAKTGANRVDRATQAGHADFADLGLRDAVEHLFTLSRSLGVKWSQVQILSARLSLCCSEGTFICYQVLRTGCCPASVPSVVQLSLLGWLRFFDPGIGRECQFDGPSGSFEL